MRLARFQSCSLRSQWTQTATSTTSSVIRRTWNFGYPINAGRKRRTTRRRNVTDRKGSHPTDVITACMRTLSQTDRQRTYVCLTLAAISTPLVYFRRCRCIVFLVIVICWLASCDIIATLIVRQRAPSIRAVLLMIALVRIVALHRSARECRVSAYK